MKQGNIKSTIHITNSILFALMTSPNSNYISISIKSIWDKIQSQDIYQSIYSRDGSSPLSDFQLDYVKMALFISATSQKSAGIKTQFLSYDIFESDIFLVYFYQKIIELAGFIMILVLLINRQIFEFVAIFGCIPSESHRFVCLYLQIYREARKYTQLPSHLSRNLDTIRYVLSQRD